MQIQQPVATMTEQQHQNKHHQIWLQCMQMSQATQQQAYLLVKKSLSCVNCALTSTGQTLLMIACSIGCKNIVYQCLKNSSQIFRSDTAGRTCLHYSAAIGSIQIFELLIEKQKHVNSLKNSSSSTTKKLALQKTIGGQTPLFKACIFSQQQIIQWYLNYQLDAFLIQDNCKQSPLNALKLSNQQAYDQVKQVYQQLMKDNANAMHNQ